MNLIFSFIVLPLHIVLIVPFFYVTRNIVVVTKLNYIIGSFVKKLFVFFVWRFILIRSLSDRCRALLPSRDNTQPKPQNPCNTIFYYDPARGNLA